MKIHVCAAFWSVLSVAIFFKTTAEPGAFILLRLNSLQNPWNLNYKYRCCNSENCKPCHYQFEIWVTCDGMREDTECLYGYSKTGNFPKRSSIVFNRTLGNGLYNPLVYNISRLYGDTLKFLILKTDEKGSTIDVYRYYSKHISLSSYSDKKMTNITQKADGRSNSSLSLTYSIFCKKYYHGPACDVVCLPGETHTCDRNTGIKLCRAGWYGNECDKRTSVASSPSIVTSRTADQLISKTKKTIFPSFVASKATHKSFPHTLHVRQQYPILYRIFDIVTETLSLKTTFKRSTDAPVDVGNQTKKRESLPTIKFPLTEAFQNFSASKPYSATQVHEVATNKPGSREDRKKLEIWRLVLLPLIAVVPIIVIVLVVFKKSQRKRRKVSAQRNTPLEAFKHQASSNVSPYEGQFDNNTLNIPMANSS